MACTHFVHLLTWLLNTDVSCSSVETGPSCCCLCSRTLARCTYTQSEQAVPGQLVNSYNAPPAHVAVMAKLTRLTLLWHCHAGVVAGALYGTSLLINLMLINLFERNHTKWITQLSTCSEYKSTCSSRMNVMYERGNAKTLRKALWYTATHHYKCPLVEQRSTTDNVMWCCRWKLSWNFASHSLCGGSFAQFWVCLEHN